MYRRRCPLSPIGRQYCKMNNSIVDISRPLINILFPNRCGFCGKILEKRSCICRRCLSGIELIDQPFCPGCGAPLPVGLTTDENSCNQCRDLTFHYNKNESLGVFNGKLRELIHLYKFNRRRSLYRLFAELLLKHKMQYIMDHDILISMPLSRSRHSERGFNQSYLIAREISKRAAITFYGDVITRKGNAQPQSNITTRKERLSNVTDLFIIKKRWREFLYKKNILLFDDVLTTGATASECAHSLFNAKVKNVDILTLARALRGPSTV